MTCIKTYMYLLKAIYIIHGIHTKHDTASKTSTLFWLFLRLFYKKEGRHLKKPPPTPPCVEDLSNVNWLMYRSLHVHSRIGKYVHNYKCTLYIIVDWRDSITWNFSTLLCEAFAMSDDTKPRLLVVSVYKLNINIISDYVIRILN